MGYGEYECISCFAFYGTNNNDTERTNICLCCLDELVELKYKIVWNVLKRENLTFNKSCAMCEEEKQCLIVVSLCQNCTKG